MDIFSDEEHDAGMDGLVAMGIAEFRDTPDGRQWRLTDRWVEALEAGAITVQDASGAWVTLTPENIGRLLLGL